MNKQQLMNSNMATMLKKAVDTLLKVNNTITTLEVKNELRKTEPWYNWVQHDETISSNGLFVKGISQMMDELAQSKYLIYVDTGSYRIYSLNGVVKIPTPVKKNPTKAASAPITKISYTTIGVKKAKELIENSKGHFCTAVFIKDHGNGEERTINFQYMKNQNNAAPGCIMVKETSKLKANINPIRQINLNTLLTLKTHGENYKIRRK